MSFVQKIQNPLNRSFSMSPLTKRHVLCALALLLSQSGQVVGYFFEAEAFFAVISGLQVFFVLACYFIIRQNWIVLILLIEALAMAYQVAVIKNWGDSSDIFWWGFDYFMRRALLLELVIIYGSLWGQHIKAIINAGLDRLRNTPLPASRLFCSLHRDPNFLGNSENPQ